MVRVLLLRMDSADVFLLDCDILVVRCLRERGDFCDPVDGGRGDCGVGVPTSERL